MAGQKHLEDVSRFPGIKALLKVLLELLATSAGPWTIENVPCVNENESMVKVNNEGPEVQQSCDFELSKDRCILIGLRGNRKPIHIFESIQEMPLWKVLKYQE